jgi:hypothetical protein
MEEIAGCLWHVSVEVYERVKVRVTDWIMARYVWYDTENNIT